jgi:hypothetical protein
MGEHVRTRTLLAALASAALLVGSGERGARADDAADAEVRERCAIRIAIALTGESPDAELLAASNPKDEAPPLLADQRFIDRFAAFVNMRFSDEPDPISSREPAYWLAREVLADGRPWSDLFLGEYDVEIAPSGNSQSDPTVTPNPEGLGYFRSGPWLRRYEGNELEGLKLTTAYQIMNNVIGLEMHATTTADGADVSAEGREAGACRGCHYEGPFALDKVARVLTRRRLDKRGFLPSPDPPQELLDGVMIADDKELVTALVASENFSFRTCRLAFEFLYGRPELTCESATFDACVDSFKAEKTMQAALGAVLTDPGFCQ